MVLSTLEKIVLGQNWGQIKSDLEFRKLTLHTQITLNHFVLLYF